MYLDTAAAATGEIMYELIDTLGVEVDLEMATCIYTALYTDCGSFKYSNTMPKTMRIAAALLEIGVKPNEISDSMEIKPRSNIEMLTKVLETLTFDADGKIAYISINNEMYDKDVDTDTFISYPRYIEGVEVAIMFKAVEKAVTRVSMRSRNLDVSEIAITFGGGGHLRAAGCTIEGKISMTSGILNVLKPCGMTSHDVVGFLRRTLQTKKIGHGGTLDPDAAGVLPVFIGTATRLLEYAVEGRKNYRAELKFGIKTDTGDDSGTIIASSEVRVVTEAEIQETLQKFIGEQKQIPPMYSAIKKDGQKLYQLARQGIEVEREARSITIDALELLHKTGTSLTLDIVCSKGTYVRTLLEDIAAELGMCGTMSFLLRKQVGDFYLSEAKTLEEIAPYAYLLPAEAAVQDLQELVLTDKQALRITQGVKTTVRGISNGTYRLKTITGDFLGIGSAESELVKAEKILKQFQADAEMI